MMRSDPGTPDAGSIIRPVAIVRLLVYSPRVGLSWMRAGWSFVTGDWRRKPLWPQAFLRALGVCCVAIGGMVMLSGALAAAAHAEMLRPAVSGVGAKQADAGLEGQCASQPESSGSVQVCAWIKPEGATVSRCEFEYGVTPSYGTDTPCTPEPPYSGDQPVRVAGPLTGLLPGVTYHYRVAIVSEGTKLYGPDEELSAPAITPAVTSESVSNETSRDATLEADINPGGAETTYRFEIAKAPACLPPPGLGYLPCAEVEVGSLPSRTIAAGDGNIAVVLDLASAGMTLEPGATYEFRVVASNSAAPEGIHGGDVEFTAPRSQGEIEAEGVAKAHAEEAQAAGRRHQEEEAASEQHAEEQASVRRQEEAQLAKRREEAAAAAGAVAVEIVKVRVSPSSATVTLDASRAATVTISGRGLRTTSKGVVVGGNEIKVALTKAGESSRRSHKKIKITVQVKAPGRAIMTSELIKL